MNTLKKCLNIIVTALADMGGEIYSVELEYKNKKALTPDLNPRKIKLDYDYVNKNLGLNLNKKEILNLLERMGYGFEKDEILIPAYRDDILHQIDLVEDIAIAYGYEKFGEMPKSQATIGEENHFEKFSKKVKNMLIGLGLLEVKNLHLMKKEQLKCDDSFATNSTNTNKALSTN